MRHLASFASEPEARALQAALASEGIACGLTNAEVVANFWQYSNAVGGVGVEVAEADWEAAQAIMGTNTAPGVEWVCTKCDAENDAGFALCWQCGGEQTQPIEPSISAGGQSSKESHQSQDSANQEKPLPNRDLEQLHQAWKAARFGLLFFHGLLHVYSLGLLLTIKPYRIPENEVWKYYAAWAIDLVMIGVLYLFFTSLFSY